MKKTKKILLIILVILVTTIASLVVFTTTALSWQTNSRSFSLESKHDMIVSTYDKNGSDWGHNQSKLASIGDVIFTFHFDNANLENGNSSDTNPYYLHFIMIIDGTETEIDEAKCNRPGNVLADEINDKIYYIVSEPAGPACDDGYDFSSYAMTVMYEYDYNRDSMTTEFVEKHIVTEVDSDGKIRQGVAMDGSGNITIAYGTYSGQIKIYVYDHESRTFTNDEYTSNQDGDSLMYCNVAMLDLDHVYVLAQQDTSREDEVYYQYVKFFAWEHGVWSDHMVVDYRDHEKAEEHPSLVLNCDLFIHDGLVHMAAASVLLGEVTYLTYDGENYHEEETNYLPNGTANLKFMEFDGELYIASMSFLLYFLIPTFTIISVDSQEVVYRMVSVENNGYFYIDEMNQDTVNLLIYTSKQGTLYSIEYDET